MAMVFVVPHNRNLLFLALLPLSSFEILSILDSFPLNDSLYKDHILEYYPKDILLMDVSFYIWNKRFIELVLVLPSSYFPLEHLLVFPMYLRGQF